MATAFDGLDQRLEFLSDIIQKNIQKHVHIDNPGSITEDDRTRWMNEKLLDFREAAFNIPFAVDDKTGAPAKRLTARLFSYIHNEFNFNSPRPLSRCARVAHLVFTPLHTQKTANDPDTFKQISVTTDHTLKLLLRKSKEESDQSNRNRRSKSFRGGKDRIFKFVGEIFDFTEPFITTKRSLIERKTKLLKRAPAVARDMTEALDRRLVEAGPSNRLTNTVEMFLDGPPEIKHFRWTRHSRPCHTFTLTHEMESLPSGEADPFAKTALHAFPEETFDDVFGRYIQGANWLIVPVERFFNESLAKMPNEQKRSAVGRLLNAISPETEDDTLARALAKLSDLDTAEGLTALGDDPAAWTRDNSDERIATVFDDINTKTLASQKVDRLVAAASDGFLRSCFGEDESGQSHTNPRYRQRSEYIGLKCMDGRAYIFANLRNNHSQKSAQHDPEQQTVHDIFTRAVIIDCGMNRFQRGRLLQNMSEFATERTLALMLVPRFRLVRSALDVIEAKLNQAISNYHNNKEQLARRRTGSPDLGEEDDDAVVPYEYWHALHRDLEKTLAEKEEARHRAARERKLIVALKFLSSCLTILNDLVEGGIADRASSTMVTIRELDEKLDSIREEPIAGHQTLRDFLRRRFNPAARMIVRVGDRYHRLRGRIQEIADLTNVNLSAVEWFEHQKQAKRQTTLLTVAEFFGEAALGYYASNLTVEFLNSAVCIFWNFTSKCGTGDGETHLDAGVAAIVYVVFTALTIILIAVSARRIIRDELEAAEVYNAEAPWPIGIFLKMRDFFTMTNS